MGIITRLQSRDTSVTFNEVDDAFRVEKDAVLTNFRSQDVDIARDLVFEDARGVAQDLEAILYESGDAHGKGSNAFTGATTTLDGRVVFSPLQSVNIGIYDPSTDTYSDGIAHGEGSLAFWGATTLQDGRIVFAPYNSSNVGIYDPSANSYTNVSHPENSSAFRGATTLSDGRVIFIPYQSDNVGIFDPNDTTQTPEGTYTSGPAHGESGTFNGYAKLSDDRVVFVPFTSFNIGIFDPSDNSYTNVSHTADRTSGAFIGGTALQNDRVVFAPYNNLNVGIFDPNNTTQTPDGTYISGPAHGEGLGSTDGGGAFGGAEILDNGQVVFIPYNSDNVGIFNPDTDTYTSGVTHGENSQAFNGATILDNGRIVAAPLQSDNIGIIFIEKSQFLLRNPETGITEGVDYDNLEQFIDIEELGINPDSLVAPGNDNEISFNDNGTFGASSNLIFDDTFLESPGIRATGSAGIEMDFVPDIPVTANLVSGSGQNVYLYYVIGVLPDGRKTGASLSAGVETAPSLDSTNFVQLSWEERPSVDQYIVVRTGFDFNTFQQINEVVEVINDSSVTTLDDTGQSTGNTLPTLGSNETFGTIKLAPRNVPSPTIGDMMIMDPDGQVGLLSGSSTAKHEGQGAFTIGQRRLQGSNIGTASFAAGRQNTASGNFSAAFGDNTTASGSESFAAGTGSVASGQGAAAFGGSQATDSFAFAAGSGTQATEFNAFAEGNSTIASGSAAHAEGFNTEALGTSSHAEGAFTLARGRNAHAGGDNTIARVFAGRAVGMWNEDYLTSSAPNQQGIEDTSLNDRMFAVGVGDDPSASSGTNDYIDGRGRVDGLYVTIREGTFVRHGLTIDGYNGSNQQYEPILKIGESINTGTDTTQVLTRNPSTNTLEYVDGSALGGISVPGNDTEIVFNDQGNLGSSSNFTFNDSTSVFSTPVLNLSNANGDDKAGDMLVRDSATARVITLDGTSAVAKYEGDGAFTLGSRADGSTVTENSIAIGIDVESSGDGDIINVPYASVAIGTGAIANRYGAIAIGKSTASGAEAIAMGQNTVASGPQSTTFGVATQASGGSSTAMGRDTNASGRQSTAMGENTTASGRYSTAMGYNTEANSTASIAMGDQTISRTHGSVTQGIFNEDYLGAGNEVFSIPTIAASDRMFAVGVGDNPGSINDYNDGLGRADGLYVTYRDGTYIREGLTIERFETNGSGDYVKTNGVTQVETVLSIDNEITSGSDFTQVLVRNPSTNILEYVDGSTLGTQVSVPGNDTELLFNNSGSFGATSLLTLSTKFNINTNTLVNNSDIEFTSSSNGIILTSGDGTRYKLTTENDGSLKMTELA